MAKEKFIPYGRQSIDDDDIQSVVDVLQSEWLTTGPMVPAFEKSVADFSGAAHAVAVSNGTAGLHCAMFAAGVGPGDEVVAPTMTFAASTNAALYVGAKPVFADIDPATLLVDPASVEKKITPRTKAIVAVDYGGQTCDYDSLCAIAQRHKLILIADACHALGATYKGKPAGKLADLSVFSFHPVKHITTAEGGLVTTDNPDFARRLRLFRSHGISTDHRERAEKGILHYEMIELGYNYRLSDLQCALGLSQMKKLSQWVKRRNEIAHAYAEGLRDFEKVELLKVRSDSMHAYHLYVIKLRLDRLSRDRNTIFSEMRNAGIGVNVHYPPVYSHPYYKRLFGDQRTNFPATEKVASQILSIPMYPAMTDAEVQKVIYAIRAL